MIRKKSNKKLGFTLFEIIISLFIIGVFIALFIPAIINIYGNLMNLSNTDISFNTAYSETIYEANNVNSSPVKYSDVDIQDLSDYTTLKIYDDKGNNVKIDGKNLTFEPENFYVYTKEYNFGTIGSNTTLYFNAYSLNK